MGYEANIYLTAPNTTKEEIDAWIAKNRPNDRGCGAEEWSLKIERTSKYVSTIPTSNEQLSTHVLRTQVLASYSWEKS